MLPTRAATTWLLAVLLAAGSVFGQSMVETAKKEKARREAAKKGTTVAVTNADLSRTKKKPAMVLVPDSSRVIRTGDEEAAPGDKPRPSAVAAPGAVLEAKAGSEVASEAAVDFNQKKSELQTAFDKAQERAELLDLKMRALNQQLFTFNSMSSKEQIQKAIADTYQTLLDARADATKTKGELDKFLNQASSAKQPPIWIKRP